MRGVIEKINQKKNKGESRIIGFQNWGASSNFLCFSFLHRHPFRRLPIHCQCRIEEGRTELFEGKYSTITSPLSRPFKDRQADGDVLASPESNECRPEETWKLLFAFFFCNGFERARLPNFNATEVREFVRQFQ